MEQQTLYLADQYKRRITNVAQTDPVGVTLTARNTSGKTYTLFINRPSGPGVLGCQRVIVRLHRTAHKLFWQIVKQAQAWLAGFKLLYAPQPLLLPATIGDARIEQQKLLTAASKIPVKAETPKVAAYDWKARKEEADAIPEKRFTNRWDAARAKPGHDGGNPRRKMGLA